MRLTIVNENLFYECQTISATHKEMPEIALKSQN